MYTITYFGQTITATGSIHDAINAAGLDVGNMDPYINGTQGGLHDTPSAGAKVTFRPRASGKA